MTDSAAHISCDELKLTFTRHVAVTIETAITIESCFAANIET